MLSTANYKGTRDFYPQDLAKRNYIFDTWRQVISSRGFEEYETSLLESKELYTAKSGEELANTQLYWFTDKGDREVALRPEQTPSLARLVSAKLGELSLPVRWFSIPNCFRYERPQKGRLREFWQLNVDIVGSAHFSSDAELLSLVYQIFKSFGAEESIFKIKLNHREVLDSWIELHGWTAQKSEIYALLDSWHKLDLDKKSTWLAELGINYNFDALSDKHSPEFLEYQSLLMAHKDFKDLYPILTSISPTAFEISPCIVRGIAYYTGVVFEAYDTHEENNRALFGGGRYDNLLELFGKSVPATGFGWGDVTMHEFLTLHNLYPESEKKFSKALVVETPESLEKALLVQSELGAKGMKVVLDTNFERALNKREQAMYKIADSTEII